MRVWSGRSSGWTTAANSLTGPYSGRFSTSLRHVASSSPSSRTLISTRESRPGILAPILDHDCGTTYPVEVTTTWYLVLGALLFEVSPVDPVTFLTVGAAKATGVTVKMDFTGSLEGRGTTGNIQVVASSAGFNANISLTTRGNKQSVVIRSESVFRGASISLSRH